MESSPPKRWKRFKVALVLVTVLTGASVFMLREFEHSQVYHPQRHHDASAAALGRTWEDVNFSSADGLRLHGWFFPAENPAAGGGHAVLLCHGNGGNISHRMDLYQALLESDLSVFAFDYRGYGRSQGRPSEQGTYMDASAALKWLERRGFGPSSVIVLGESLGGGVASELATRKPLAGLILLSTFTSVPDLGCEIFPWLPVRWLCGVKYDTKSRFQNIHMPVLVMHSRYDGLIGFHHARANFDAAGEPKLFWELTGTHNDPLHDPANFSAGIGAFLEKLELSQAASRASSRR